MSAKWVQRLQTEDSKSVLAILRRNANDEVFEQTNLILNCIYFAKNGIFLSKNLLLTYVQRIENFHGKFAKED